MQARKNAALCLHMHNAEQLTTSVQAQQAPVCPRSHTRPSPLLPSLPPCLPTCSKGDKVSLFSENSSRWLVADQAIMMCGAADAVRGRQPHWACNTPEPA